MPSPERVADAQRAILLGLLQGPTELLPISSSAHTRLLPWLLGAPWRSGDAEAHKAFEVALHLGAGAALAIDMRSELVERAAEADGGQWAALLLAILPAVLAGGLLKGPIERRLGGPRSIAAGLVLGSAAMVYADTRGARAHGRHFSELGPIDGLAVGVGQALALIPGVSRNGATLSAARLRGFSREDSQAISWGVALPVILGAGALKAGDLRRGDGVVAGAAAAFGSTLAAARALRRRAAARPVRRLQMPARKPRRRAAREAPVTALGSVIAGRYRLDEEVGRGGMSTVYRAFDTVLERPVAIKLMHREIASDSDQLERFRREARSVAQLNHPHIVAVIDAGEEPGETGTDVAAPFIVLEFVPGETLKTVIRREGQLEITMALAYGIEIARALAAAHDRQIVHRDVKPHNILLGEEGGAKITDFGIARSLTEESLTLTGRVLGTTDYVSPEQALGNPVTGQSDVYSLGVVLYEALTGQVPFHADSPVAVAMKHVRDQPTDIRELRPELSAATAATVERAMEKDTSLRYPDAASFAAALEDVLAIEAARSGQAGGEVTSVINTLPPAKRRRVPLRLRNPRRWAALVAVVVLIAAALVYLLVIRTHAGTEAPVREGPLTVVPLAQNAATSYNPFGTEPENPHLAANLVDGDPTTSWSSAEYYGGTLRHPSGQSGFGVYLDAAPGLDARAMQVLTTTPGSPPTSTFRTRSTSRSRTATPLRSRSAAGSARSGPTKTSRAPPASSSTSPAKGTATTCSGSLRSRRARAS